MGKIGIILGSGLDKFAEELSGRKILFENRTGVHNKIIISGIVENHEVIVFQGRSHIYEGVSPDKVLFNVEFANKNEVELIIITNAAGGLNPHYKVSDLMMINSHFNLLFSRIISSSSYGIYDKNLIARIRNEVLKENIKLHIGVYCASTGPTYETKSEIKFLKKSGADAVGMSTIPELLYAFNSGIKVLGISCITNLLNTVNDDAITNHEEVVEAGNNAYLNFSRLLRLIIRKYKE